MPRQSWGRFRDGYYGGPVNPTADHGLAAAAGDTLVLATSLTPSDDEWIPQLYQKHSIPETARISGLSKGRVKQILTSQGVEVRAKGQRPKQK